jgi:acylphosphatase
MERRVIRYTGRVQGVGFRATAYDAVRPFDITGFVRNEPDDSVRLEAQGEPAQIDGALAAVRTRLNRFITREDASPMPTVPGEPRFEIRR